MDPVQNQQELLSVMQQLAETIRGGQPQAWSQGQVLSRLELLESYWNNFVGNHVELLHSDPSRASPYFQGNLYARAELTYLDTRGQLYDLQYRGRPRSMNDEVPSGLTAARGSSRLPRIVLPQFSGQRAEWEPFKELFCSLIHNDPILTDVEKLYYLKAHVQGEAKTALDTLQTTGANYTTAWTALESRYDQKRLLVQDHLKALLSTRPIKEESAAGFYPLLDELKRHRDQLDALERPTEHWDDWFVTLAANAMDPMTRCAWEENLGAAVSPNSHPTFDQRVSYV